MMPRTIRTDPLANWYMFEARDRYRILTAALASPRGFLKSVRNIELTRKPSRRLSGSSKNLERLHARRTLRQQFLSRGRKKYKRCMKYVQHWRKLRAARPAISSNAARISYTSCISSGLGTGTAAEEFFARATAPSSWNSPTISETASLLTRYFAPISESLSDSPMRP